jgi:4-hydroxybenzoate polyprenyltransferase
MAREKSHSESRVVAVLQILRLPNVFTAIADVTMGFLVTHASLRPGGLFALLAAASCLLYLAGMVLNDVFDAEVDARERPARPIPSGRVPLATATALGWAMLASGIVFAGLAAFLAGNWRPVVVAAILAICVVLYDGTLKRTPLAPLFMGACRTLNVLLGMSLAALSMPLADGSIHNSRPWLPTEWLIAIGIGVYIVGVTIFGRTEARGTSRVRLAVGTFVMLAGIVVVAAAPFWRYGAPAKLWVRVDGWFLLWSVIALLILRRCVVAVLQPVPARVQAAVRNAVQSIIVIDAAVCVGLAGRDGAYWGLAVLLLMAPTFLLTKWLQST